MTVEFENNAFLSPSSTLLLRESKSFKWKYLMMGIGLVILCLLLGGCASTVRPSPESTSPIPTTSSVPLTPPTTETVTQPPAAVANEPNHPLKTFYQALDRLTTKGTVINILHLGDSHTTSNHFNGHLRHRFQERFGDAGRGMLPVGKPFTYFNLLQINLTQTGPWQISNSLKTTGNYGISGFITSSNRSTDSISLEITTGRLFEEVDIEFLRHPQGGTLLVDIDGQTWDMATNGDTLSAHLVLTVPGGGRKITLKPQGDGTIKLLSWTFLHKNGGVLYHSHGIVGATVNVMERWDPQIVTQEMQQLKPDLIIIAYGTNEGFNDRLKLNDYEKSFREKMTQLQQGVPQKVAIVIAGPPDAQRLPGYCPKQSIKHCDPLNTYEIEHYSTLLAEKNPRLCRWHSPPRLNDVREIQRRIAAEAGYLFWDWSQVMGNYCGTHDWTAQTPPRAAADHVHLKAVGYQESAEALYQTIMKGYH